MLLPVLVPPLCPPESPSSTAVGRGRGVWESQREGREGGRCEGPSWRRCRIWARLRGDWPRPTVNHHRAGVNPQTAAAAVKSSKPRLISSPGDGSTRSSGAGLCLTRLWRRSPPPGPFPGVRWAQGHPLCTSKPSGALHVFPSTWRTSFSFAVFLLLSEFRLGAGYR